MRLLLLTAIWLLFIVGAIPHPGEFLISALLNYPITDIPKSGVALFFYWPIFYLTGLGLYLVAFMLAQIFYTMAAEGLGPQRTKS